MIKPLISVCLTNFNGEKYLNKTIESVLNQTYENFELIIMDNASTDSSADIVRQYNDSRIKFFQNDRSTSVSKNTNKTVLLSRGELITILHSEDLYAPNFLEELVRTYEKYPTKKVFITGVYFYYSDVNKLKAWLPFKIGGLKTKQEVLSSLIRGNTVGNGINVAYHRSCISGAGVFSEKYKFAGVYEYLIRLAELYDFVYIPKILTYYRVHTIDFPDKINKNLPVMLEGYEIFNNKLLNNTLINKNSLHEANFIHACQEIQKAFYTGVKYDSGLYTRKSLALLKKKFPSQRYNLYWYFVYGSSVFIDVPFKFMKNIFVFLIGSVLYPYEKTCEYKQKILMIKIQPPKPIQKTSCRCSCGCSGSKTCG